MDINILFNTSGSMPLKDSLIMFPNYQDLRGAKKSRILPYLPTLAVIQKGGKGEGRKVKY